jgi:hypothetical protein
MAAHKRWKVLELTKKNLFYVDMLSNKNKKNSRVLVHSKNPRCLKVKHNFNFFVYKYKHNKLKKNLKQKVNLIGINTLAPLQLQH